MRSSSQVVGIEERAPEIHRSAYVFDGCVPANGLLADQDAEVAALQHGAVDGVSVILTQHNDGFKSAIQTIARHKALAGRRSDALRFCSSVAELEQTKADGKIGLVVHFQNSKPFEERLENLEVFRDLGLRVLQLTYNAQDYVGTGCAERYDGGLSQFGLDVVAECNRLGILVDLSHCSPATTWDAIRHSRRPVALTHGGSYALCAASGRNKTDDLMKAIADTGGVVGITVYPALVKRDRATHRVLQANIEDVLDHFEHLISVIGHDHVAIGSDLSEYAAKTLGVPEGSSFRRYRLMRPDVFGGGAADRYDPYPLGLDSHAKMLNITRGLARRGYSEDVIRKILGLNWLRLFRNVWDG